MRGFAGSNNFGVNLANLIRLAWAKGFQGTNGSSVPLIGEVFGQEYGIPVEGTMPDNERLHLPDVDPEDGDSTDSDCFALGTTVHTFRTKPLPFGAPTAAEAKACVEYREHLCLCLENGPVVLLFQPQEHYGVARGEGEPYRRRNIPIEREEARIYHCITAYGYDCPDETVRTLRIIYQENMVGAPGDEPRRGLYIDPDAIDRFYVPDITEISLSRSPAEGYQTVHRSPPPPPPPPPPSNMWERIRSSFRF